MKAFGHATSTDLFTIGSLSLLLGARIMAAPETSTSLAMHVAGVLLNGALVFVLAAHVLMAASRKEETPEP